MKRYEEREVIKKEKVLREIICDECDKNINETEHDFYYEVVTSHSQWGNDSIDSLDYLDLCCWECVTNNLGGYFANEEDTYRYEIELVKK